MRNDMETGGGTVMLQESLENSYTKDYPDDASGDGGSSTAGDGSTTDLKDRAAKETKRTLARNETRAVSCLRYVVLLVMLVTAIGVSLSTFYYSRSVEEENFEAEFASVAGVTLRSFVDAVESKLSAMDSVSSGITSHALRTGETFPNVTVPDWEVKGATLRTQTDGIYLFWLPLVTDENRRGFEEYTKLNQGHLFQSYAAEEGFRAQQDTYFGLGGDEGDADGGATRQLHAAGPDVHPVMHDEIWGSLNPTDGSYDFLPEGAGPFLACWQLSPIIPLPSILNFNFFAFRDLAPMFHEVLETGKAVLGFIQTTHEGTDTEDLIRTFLTLGQYRDSEVAYDADPMTQVVYPVFDSFGPDRQVTGLILTTIFWRLLFEDVLPSNVRGVICVLQNTLGEDVTYRIDGRRASLLGKGDLHNPKYDNMGVTRDISEYIAERASPESTSYTSVELDTGYTSYILSVYPSGAMEGQFVTSDPIINAVAISLVFVFTSLVFLVYDWLVEKRQKKVMDKAVKSTAVVSSLFPEAVHSRLFADKSEEMVWKNDEPEKRASIKAFLVDGKKPTKNNKGRPIADKFEDVTVLFADLAGFTKWSSSREPEQVFELLETLYSAFDKIALRRQVFKVETIGDCYMAATGLPDPQPDHALRMAKFARDCMVKMGLLLEELGLSLGEDTLDLAMRVGMHSGGVTGGVLRGDKTRFQLFGDTVNTASRMESNGMKGKIHCSQTTADALISAGRSQWLTSRVDKITAKGKGEMQTYWIKAAGKEHGSSVSEDVDRDGEPLTTVDDENEMKFSIG